jgi:hypothetical protein
MRRFFLLLLPAALLSWSACKDEQVVVIKADAGDVDARTEEDGGDTEQPPDGTQTDAGLAGRRLGDKGCKGDQDCDSNTCVIAANAADNYCSAKCTAASAPTVCVPPLTAHCSRTLVCDPPAE